MKTLTPVLVAVSMVLFPAGVALAKGGADGVLQHNSSAGVNVGVHADVEIDEGTGRDHEKDDDMRASSTASTTLRTEMENKSENSRIDKREHASSTASSTHDRGRGQDRQDNGLRGLPSFLRWLFGLPATTTIGDIRAQINATTTASTTPGSSEGLGFFARLFGFLHFGRGADN